MAFSSWFKRNQALLGLAFDSTSVQLLHLQQQGREPYRIAAFGAALIKTGVIAHHDIIDPTALAGSIRLAHQQSGSRIKHVAVAIPSVHVIDKYLALDTPPTQDSLFALILSEASQLVPYALTEVALDYPLLSYTKAEKISFAALLICARQAHIDRITHVIKLAGLIPAVMDVDTYAIARACERLFPLLGLMTTSLIAIVAMTLTSISFIGLQDHRVIFAREETLALSFQVASEVEASLLAFIQRSRQLLSVNQPQNIQHLLLCGLPQTHDHVTASLQAATGIAVTLMNPLLSIVNATQLEMSKIPINATTLTMACGLAMRQKHDTLY